MQEITGRTAVPGLTGGVCVQLKTVLSMFLPVPILLDRYGGGATCSVCVCVCVCVFKPCQVSISTQNNIVWR